MKQAQHCGTFTDSVHVTMNDRGSMIMEIHESAYYSQLTTWTSVYYQPGEIRLDSNGEFSDAEYCLA